MKTIYFLRANKTKHGGAEVYLSRLSEALNVKGIQHTLIHSNIPKVLPSWLRALMFNTKVCAAKIDNSFYFSLERITCADVYRAGDGVHKVFVSVENKSFLNPLHSVYIYLEKKCFQNSKKIIANSQMIKQQIIDTYDIPSDKIEVIHNGIKLEHYDKKISYVKLQKEFSLDEHKMTILYVGSGFKRKGVKEFLHILSKLTSMNFQAFVVGKEKKMKDYRNLSKELGIENKVIFTGPRDDVKDFYAISDIFLFPTRYEPFSNVVLEAMMYENAVITTQQNGAHEILDDTYNMKTPYDFSIVPKIDALLENEKILQKVKERNLEIVQNFTIEKNVEKTLKVIDEVIC